MVHILLDLKCYIDMCLNTRLFHDHDLKSMEVHLLMTDCENLTCKYLYNIFFCINKFLQVAMLAGVLPCKNIGLLIFDLVV
jgi:hypothetical protein